jgi:hypothetical protein
MDVHAVPFHRSAAGIPFVSPTAVQLVGVGQDSASGAMPVIGGVRDQAVPFHRSANASVDVSPTAMQAVRAAHDTASSLANVSPLGSGAETIDHDVPFHVSTSGVFKGDSPTAVHWETDRHDSEVSSPVEAPAGSGTSWIVQDLPFQTCAYGAWPAMNIKLPKATHAVDDVHETAPKLAPVVFGGFGLVRRVHVVPFQVSTNGSSMADRLETSPTDMQKLPDVHEMLASRPPGVREGVGAAAIDQVTSGAPAAAGGTAASAGAAISNVANPTR